MTKLGPLLTAGQSESEKNIWVIGWQKGKITIKVCGKESFASSNVPDIWFLQGSRVMPAYSFKEIHGLKVRSTAYNFRPYQDPDIHLYHDGKFWKITRSTLAPIFDCTDDDRLVEIKDQSIWFDGHQLAKLPEEGFPGTWYPTADLEVVLAEDFHDKLVIDLDGSCEGTLAAWTGKELRLRLSDNAKASVDKVVIGGCYVYPSRSSKVDIESLTCDKFDSCARSNSVVSVQEGQIKDASMTEVSGGKVNISAQVDKLNNKSEGIPNSKPIIRKQTPKGTILEFPNNGNFEIKQPGGL